MTILSAEKSSGTFEANVDWSCASDSIQVLVRTPRPFHGLIHPSGFPAKKPPHLSSFSSSSSASCAMRGNGTLTTQLQIPLEPGNSAWDECGIQMDPDTSTLWVLLEVHEHPLVMLKQDRTVNISCTGWSQATSDIHSSADQPSDFRLAIVSSNGTSAACSPVDFAFLGTEYNLSVQAVQPMEWTSIFVHSCAAIGADQQMKVQLIDSDGCSMDKHLITDFEQSNRLLFNSFSSTPLPMIIQRNQRTQSTQSLTTANQKLPLVTVATAKIPQMFRFNTQFDQRRLNIGSVIHFECTVERCEERIGKTPSAITPCPRTNCDRKRTIAEKQQQSVITKQAEQHHNVGDAVDEVGAKLTGEDEELELVTQLLRAQQREEEGEEEAQFGGGEGETDEDEAVTEVTQKKQQKQNGTEMADEKGKAKANGGKAKANGGKAKGEAGRNRTAQEEEEEAKAVSGEVKQQQNPQQLQLVHRRQKQLQTVEKIVRVFETQRSIREGTVLSVPKPPNSNGDAEKNLDAIKNSSQPPADTSKHTDDSTALDHNPLFINDSTDFVMLSSTDSAIMPTYNFTNSTSSPQDAAAPSARLRPPHLQCVSMDQLSRLYMLGIALCALFLIGCLFNLLMCCLGRRRTAAETGGGSAALQMPFRTKRGRRHHPAQQKVMSAAGGHSSHTTLTSSLYGGGANEAKNGNGSKAQQQQQQVGFWISEDGQRNGGGTIEYAPMVSSFYEGLPNVTDVNNNNNNVPQQQQRRLSVHSYASVKQRGNAQLLCKMPMPMNNGSSSMAVQQQQHVNQQLSMSPSSYSPSTTASSSTSGGGGGGGAVGPMFHDSVAHQQQQQQQYPPLLHNAKMRSTFHPPMGGGEQHKQQSNSSVASSVRSSTTLDGGGPSCSQSTAGDESDSAVAGGTTPRPFGIGGGEFGTVQHHQQQYNPNNNGTNGGTNMHSTFRCPTAESNAMLVMNNGDHLNESFSIL
ncbi:hypothetical protein niasHS_008332 [Heterodera schachtii]|uniref:ZP domain-containing protein n=1 Tax=Heterodera schachtii TaxID=97005 RepID=A0ABD2J3R8_HETSC